MGQPSNVAIINAIKERNEKARENQKVIEFETTRWGAIQYRQEDVIHFPDGPLGFPDCTEFTFIDEDRMAPFRCLQSLDNPALAFVVTDPLVADPDYRFEVTVDQLKVIAAESTDDLYCYCVVAMARDIHDVTINLQSPLVINMKEKMAHQFVIDADVGYTTRHKLLKPIGGE